MKTKKIVILYLFLAFPLSYVTAQPTDYEDFYKIINSFSDEKVYSKLLFYQRQDPYFANTYAQLGFVINKLMLKTDPLKDYNQAINWAETGILYLALYKHYMHENESRSNKSFYTNLPINKTEDRFTNLDLTNYANYYTKQFESYRDSLKLVYGAIERSKEYYGKSISLYRDLNNRFNNQNDLWLQTDDKILGEIKKLKDYFDSTIINFNIYKEHCKTFELKDYNQKYTLKSIQTFRLDGLTNSNFLANEFQIWDFGTWTNEFLAVYNSDILPLRQETETINQWFSENEKLQIDRKVDLKNAPKPIFDEKYIFKLGKYDNNSLVRELMTYKNAKYKFLQKYNDPLNSPYDSIVDILSRKARFYNDLRVSKQLADSSLLVFEGAINQERVNRFSNFFTSSYGGKSGLIDYSKKQKEELEKILNISFINLKGFLRYQNDIYDKVSFFKYKNDSIPTYKVPFDFIGKYRTNDVSRISGKPSYISGFDISKTNATQFVSFVDKSNKIKWYKQIDKPFAVSQDANSSVSSKVHSYNGGCIAIFTRQSNEMINTLVKLDSTGKELYRTPIAVATYPVFINCDDINQRVMIACKGISLKKSEELEVATICQTDSVGVVKWKTALYVAGDIIDIIRTEGLFQVFLNYKSYGISGKLGSADPSGTNWGVLIVNLDDKGEIKDVIPINQPYTYHVTNIIKLSGQSICLIGYKSKPGQTDGVLYYSIINSSGKIIYSN